MYKVFTLNIAKDSKGVPNYKINRLFMLYFTMKFLFFTLIYTSDMLIFVNYLKEIKISISYYFWKNEIKLTILDRNFCGFPIKIKSAFQLQFHNYKTYDFQTQYSDGYKPYRFELFFDQFLQKHYWENLYL